MSTELSAALLSSVAGIVLSLMFEYVPGLSDWYNKLLNNYQKLVMLGILVLVSVTMFGLNCFGWFTGIIPKISCDGAGVQTLVVAIIASIMANQATYLISPKIGDRD